MSFVNDAPDNLGRDAGISMNEAIAKRDDPVHIRDSFGESLIKSNSLLQGFSDDLRLPFNRGLDHFISKKRVQSNSSGKLQNEIARRLHIEE